VAINSTFRYYDDVLYIKNEQFHVYVDPIYSGELEINDTIEESISVAYLGILLNIEGGRK
jgi:hypothetical protein